MTSETDHGPGDRAGLFAPAPRPVTPGKPRRRPSLPPDLRQQATRRLQTTAFAYAAAFTLADFVPLILSPQDWARFRLPGSWLPSALAILSGLVFGLVIPNARLGWSARVNFGLAFQVAGSYGIAIAQTLGASVGTVTSHMVHSLSPGWVAIWMVFYTVVVPAPPGRRRWARQARFRSCCCSCSGPRGCGPSSHRRSSSCAMSSRS
jgi:hypothetical protein